MVFLNTPGSRDSMVRRRKHRDDGRMVFVALTASGRRKIDRALETHTANQTRLLNGLTPRERTSLEALLRTLQNTLEHTDPQVP